MTCHVGRALLLSVIAVPAFAEPERPARLTLTPQMVGREEFEQAKMFSREARLQPSKGAVEAVVDPQPVPRGTAPTELAAVLARLQRSFFIGEFMGKAKLQGDIDFLPDLEKLEVKWTRVVDDKGNDVLRAPTPEEVEHDRSFHFSEVSSTDHGPTYSTELRVKETAGSLVRAEGEATAVLPGELVAFEMPCDKPGVPVRHAGAQMTLRRCANDVAEVDWELPATGALPKTTGVVRDAQGRRLQVNEQVSEGVLADGRTLDQLDYKDLPVTTTIQRLTFRATGKAASVTVFLLRSTASRTFHVVATSEPKLEGGKLTRLDGSRFAERSTPGLGFVTARVEDMKAQTRVVAARTYAVADYNEPELYLTLPRNDNSAFATVTFAPVRLTKASGRAVPHREETTWVSYPALRQRLDLKPPEGAKSSTVEFAKARGTVKVRYPLAIDDLSLTNAEPAAPGIRVKLDGPSVLVTAEPSSEEALKAPSFAPSNLATIQAFDAEGNQLRPLGSGTWAGDTDEMRFWGRVARVRILRCTKWAEYEVPFDLASAPLLPKGREGRAP